MVLFYGFGNRKERGVERRMRRVDFFFVWRVYSIEFISIKMINFGLMN